MSRDFTTENLIGVRDKTGIREWGKVPVVPVGQEIGQTIGEGDYKLLAWRDPETDHIWLQMIPRNLVGKPDAETADV